MTMSNSIEDDADLPLAKSTNKRHFFPKIHTHQSRWQKQKHKEKNNDEISPTSTPIPRNSVSMMRENSQDSFTTLMMKRSSTLPVNSFNTSVTDTSSTRNKFLKLTKRATKIAGDIAFGSGIEDGEGHHLPYMRHFNQPKHYEYQQLRQGGDVARSNLQQELEMEYHAKLRNLQTLGKSHMMDFYLDYLRFFLTYMDEAEKNDAFNYSNTRNSFWNQWLVKYLVHIREVLDVRDAKKEEGQKQEVNTEDSIEELKLKIEGLPTIEQIDKETFQDRRILLLLLWQNQILYKLSNQKDVLKKLLLRNDNMREGGEICIITTNRIKPFQSTPGECLPKLLKDHLSPSKLELIDGWQLRHDFPQFKTNLISLADRLQTILDLKSTGYLSPELHKQYPHFNDYVFLSEEFVNNKLDVKERVFLQSYSSYVSPSLSMLPLRDDSQSLIYIPDFARLVNNVSDIDDGIREFQRVLKRGGCVSLILFDIKSYRHSTERNVFLPEYIQMFINHLISQLSSLSCVTDTVISSLRRHKFERIEFVKLGVPVIDYNEKVRFNEGGSSIADQPIASMYAMFSSFLDFLRIAHVSKLHTWINDPENAPLMENELEVIRVLKLWIDWKLNNVDGEVVKEVVHERIKSVVDGDGVDEELGVRLVMNDGGVWDGEKFYESWSSVFSDGLVVGLDAFFLVTAEKKAIKEES